MATMTLGGKERRLPNSENIVNANTNILVFSAMGKTSNQRD